jgi:hypothetical protein
MFQQPTTTLSLIDDDIIDDDAVDVDIIDDAVKDEDIIDDDVVDVDIIDENMLFSCMSSPKSFQDNSPKRDTSSLS